MRSVVNAVCPDMCSGSWSLDLQQMVARRGRLIKTHTQHTHTQTHSSSKSCAGGWACRGGGATALWALIRLVKANHFKSSNNSF